MPNNFAYVGFIKAILPNAKIIDARRHPMDGCFGCFGNVLLKDKPSYDLFELGEFYLEYQAHGPLGRGIARCRALRAVRR